MAESADTASKRRKTSTQGSKKGRQGPGDFLRLIKGKNVLVKLNDGSCYTGTFICMDGCLNVVMENVVLWESMDAMQTGGLAKGCSETEVFSDVFIRGNNVAYIAPYSKESLSDQEDKLVSKGKEGGSQSSSSGDSSSSDQDEDGEGSSVARNAIANEQAMI